MKGCVNTLGLLKCSRSQARKVSRHSKRCPQDRISERMCEQIGVLVVPKILSHDRVEAVEIVFQERISEKMCEQIGVLQVPKISSQESVKAVKKLSFRSKISERMCKQIGVVGVPKISSQERVEAIKIEIFGLLRCPRSEARKVSRQSKIVTQERISEGMCEQNGVIQVPKIASQKSVEAVTITNSFYYVTDRSFTADGGLL